MVFRGLMGLGLGGAPVAFALFLELVPSARRGVLMVTLQGFWTVGSMLEVAQLAMNVLVVLHPDILTLSSCLCCDTNAMEWQTSSPHSPLSCS